MVCSLFFFFFQAEDGIRDLQGDWSSDVCSSDLCAFFMLMLILSWVGYRLVYKPGKFMHQLGSPVITNDSQRLTEGSGEPEASTLLIVLRGIGSRVPSSEMDVANLKVDLMRAEIGRAHV